LVSRTSALAEKYGTEKTENNLIKKLEKEKIKELMDNYEFDKTLNEIFAFIDICNEYVQSQKPWETGDKKILFELSDSIIEIAKLLLPFIPDSAEKILKVFENDKMTKSPVIFEKVELHK